MVVPECSVNTWKRFHNKGRDEMSTRTHLAGKGATLMVAAALLVGLSQFNGPVAVAADGTTAGDTTIWDVSFDDGTTGAWTQSGNSTNTVVDSPYTDTAAADGKVLEVANRTADYDGLESPTGVLVPGQTYTVSMKVRLAPDMSDSAQFAIVLRNDGAANGYAWVANASGVTDSAWTTVTNTFTVPTDATSGGTKLYTGAQNIANVASYTYYVDDIVVTTPATTTDNSTDNSGAGTDTSGGDTTPPDTGSQGGDDQGSTPTSPTTPPDTPSTGNNTTPDASSTTLWDIPFTDGTTGAWTKDGGSTNTVVDSPFSDTAAADGKVLEVANRTHDYDGLQSPTGVLVPGQTYTVSMKVRLAPDMSDSAQFAIVLNNDGAANQYAWVANASGVTSSAWTTVTNTFTVPTDATSGGTKLYIGAQNIAGLSSYTYYVDDILVTTPVASGQSQVAISTGFEDGTTDGWTYTQGNAANPPVVAVTTDDPHSGTYAACVTGRETTNAGMAFDATDYLTANTTYNFDAWMRFAPGQPTDTVVLSAHLPGASNEYPNLITNVGTVTNTGWSEVKGTFTMPSFPSTALIYFETKYNSANPAHDDNTSDFCIDDISFATPSGATAPDLTNTPIKSTVDFPVGVAVSEPQIQGAAGQLTAYHYDQVTPENAMKEGAWYDADGNFQMSPVAEEIMQYAQANDIRVYGHNLVWYAGSNTMTPAWFFNVSPTDPTPLTSSAADQAILVQRLHNHIFNVAQALSDEFGLFGSPTNHLVAFDVVNEAINDDDSPSTDGLRDSDWYRILGPDFINLAFEYADQAFNQTYAEPGSNRPVKLFLNDFGFETNPGKVQRTIDEVNALVAAGVPIDGIGSQAHVNGAMSTPVSAIENSLDQLASVKNSSGDPILVAVTELDVPACLGTGCTPTSAQIIQQGYYYRDLYNAFRDFAATHPGQMFSVTLWGLDDQQSWLGASRAPLPFDVNLQTKPAYCGIVGCDLPALQMTANVFGTDATTGDLSATATGVASAEWDKLPTQAIGDVASFGLRWAPDALSVRVAVDDASPGASDAVSFVLNGQTYTVNRDGTASGGIPAAVVENPDGSGYAMVVTLPLSDAKRGDTENFDIQVTGASTTPVGWNLGGAMGVLTLLQPLSFVAIPETATPPVIDGVGDDAAWADAATVTTQIASTQSGMQPGGAEATVKLTWAGDTLYVLATVTDPTISHASSNAYEQDSVEIFVDRGNTKASSYASGNVTQMRIGADGAVSFGSGPDAATQQSWLKSAAQLTATGYVVEAAIDLNGFGGAYTYQGVDFQVNDATGAVRTAIHNWADPTDNGYQSAAQFGVAELIPLSTPVVPPVTEPVTPELTTPESTTPESSSSSDTAIVRVVTGGSVQYQSMVAPALAGVLLMLMTGLGVIWVRRRIV